MRRLMLLFITLTVVMITSACKETGYEVKFISDGEVIHTIWIESGGKVEIPSVSKEDDVLSGWYLSYNQGSTFDEQWDFDKDVIETDITLYANWQQVYFYISIIDENNELLSKSRHLVGTDLNEYFVEQDFEREGHTFLGFLEEIPEVMPKTDLTIHTIYLINEYNLTIKDFNGDTIIDESILYNTDLSEYNNLVLDDMFGNMFLGWNPVIPDNMPASDLVIDANYQFYNEIISLDIGIENITDIIATNEYLIISDREYNSNAGRVTMYNLASKSFRHITPSDTRSNMNFGIDLEIQGDILIVGSSEQGGLKGAIYIYQLSNPEFERIITSDSENHIQLGRQVFLEGDYIVGVSSYEVDNGIEEVGLMEVQYHIFKISAPSYERVLRPELIGSPVISINEDDILISSKKLEINHYKFSNESYHKVIAPIGITEGEFGDLVGMTDRFIFASYKNLYAEDEESVYGLFAYERYQGYSDILPSAGSLSQDAIYESDSRLFLMVNTTEYETSRVFDIGEELRNYELSKLIEIGEFFGELDGCWATMIDEDILVYDFDTSSFWSITYSTDNELKLDNNSTHLFTIEKNSEGIVVINMYLH